MFSAAQAKKTVLGYCTNSFLYTLKKIIICFSTVAMCCFLRQEDTSWQFHRFVASENSGNKPGHNCQGEYTQFIRPTQRVSLCFSYSLYCTIALEHNIHAILILTKGGRQTKNANFLQLSDIKNKVTSYKRAAERKRFNKLLLSYKT